MALFNSCDRITETQSLTVYKNAFVFFPLRNACVGHYVDGNHIHFIIILSAHQRRIIEFFYLISQSGRNFQAFCLPKFPLLESLSQCFFHRKHADFSNIPIELPHAMRQLYPSFRCGQVHSPRLSSN